ncbi:MAG: hypothetical protein NC548_45700 [Lachnospiraceae bacterium]|nr:hypothetical protein [Lachnospiraceae bacterium]
MKRVITAASSRGEEFTRLHDTANYETYRSTFDQIYSILDKYGKENDNVDVLFDRASIEDQDTLIELAQSMHKPAPKVSKEQIRAKYRKLQLGYERGTLSAEQDGYFEGMCDVADAFDIDLQ